MLRVLNLCLFRCLLALFFHGRRWWKYSEITCFFVFCAVGLDNSVKIALLFRYLLILCSGWFNPSPLCCTQLPKSNSIRSFEPLSAGCVWFWQAINQRGFRYDNDHTVDAAWCSRLHFLLSCRCLIYLCTFRRDNVYISFFIHRFPAMYRTARVAVQIVLQTWSRQLRRVEWGSVPLKLETADSSNIGLCLTWSNRNYESNLIERTVAAFESCWREVHFFIEASCLFCNYRYAIRYIGQVASEPVYSPK